MTLGETEKPVRIAREEKNVETAIGAARAKQGREDML